MSLTQELYPSGHRRVTRYFDVDNGQRDVVYVDWTDVVFERSRHTGVITRASLLDRAADNFTATIHYAPDDSPLVASQSVTLTAGGQLQGQVHYLKHILIDERNKTLVSLRIKGAVLRG